VELPKAPTPLKEALVNIHANARLTLRARRDLVELMIVGFPVNEIAAQFSVSRQTVYNWWARWRAEGDAGLWDRSSRPRSCPHQTRPGVERRIVQLRQGRKLGPARIGGILEIAPSTVHQVLRRRGLNRLAWLHRPTGRVVRRIHTSRPGELVHIDAKRLGRIPTGGGWRAHGRSTEMRQRQVRTGGWDHVHSAVDAFSRIAYSEILPAEDTECCTGFLQRAHDWFAEHGITIERVLTDNGNGYKSHAWRDLCADLDLTHTRTRFYRPQTNGKVERFNRTLADEWAYVRIYRSNASREHALHRWLHSYNHHRSHTALNGNPPMSRINNLPGHHS
jgi:transposase InsO family protein